MQIKIKERQRARFHAIQALYQESITNTLIYELKTQFYIDNINRHFVDWNFFNRIIEGAIKNKAILDKKISEYAINTIASINLADLAILRLGSYELYDCLDVPYQVVLNEYVEQSKTLGTDKSHGFINSLLDKISKDFRK